MLENFIEIKEKVNSAKTQIQNLIDELLEAGKPDLAKEVSATLSEFTIAYLIGVCFKRKEYPDCIKLNEMIMTLESYQPKKTVEYYSNFVYLLSRTKDYEKGKEIAKEAINFGLSSFDLWYNYGILLKDAGDLKEAANALRRAREINPGFAMVHYQIANILMATGDYKEAIEEDEWRFIANSGLTRFRERFKKPDWDGTEGKTILVFSEQGFGDAIQNLRYLPFLREISKSVVLEIQKELASLKFSYAEKVLPRDFLENTTPEFPEHDYVLSINSLPYWFDPELKLTPIYNYLEFYETSTFDFSPYKDKIKVGLVWAGSAYHTNDKERSCYLREFKDLVGLDNVQVFSLQTGNMIRTWSNGLLWEGGDDYDVVNLLEGADFIDKIVDLMPFSKDFNDTASFIDKLDVIICVDTAVVHLAGAMGKKTWLLLPYFHEWRWKKDWYTNFKIFRQKVKNNWQDPIKEMISELQNLVL